MVDTSMCSHNRVILEGQIFFRICVWCFCVCVVLCMSSDWFRGLTRERIHISSQETAVAHKMNMILITPKHTLKTQTLLSSIQLNGCEIPLFTSAQNLGVTHDQTLFSVTCILCMYVCMYIYYIYDLVPKGVHENRTKGVENKVDDTLKLVVFLDWAQC